MQLNNKWDKNLILHTIIHVRFYRNNSLDYSELRNSKNTKIVGIWDDNDYGINDGGFDNPFKISHK